MTVLEDDPTLTTRLHPGPNPVPVIIDPRGRIVGNENVFNGPIPPVLFTSGKIELMRGSVVQIPADLSGETLLIILRELAGRRLANITVEGGAALLQAFLDNGLWEEARVFTGPETFGSGLAAPVIDSAFHQSTEWLGGDRLDQYRKENTEKGAY